MSAGFAATALLASTALAKDGARVGSDGVRFEAADGNLELTLGGRLHLDAVRFSDNGDTESDADVRRARIELSGRIAKIVKFRADREFARGGGWRNLWVGIEPVENFEVRGGNVIVPFSMEEIQSSNRSALMERSHVSALAPGFSLGGMASYSGKFFTVSAGYFGNAIDSEDNRGSERGKGFAGRVTAAPLLSKNGFVHLAAAIEHRDLDSGDEIRLSTKPGSQLAPLLLSTGLIVGGSKLKNFGAEAAFSRGPFLLQGQYVRSRIDRNLLGDLAYDAWYSQASFVVTGENYDYSRSTGTVAGVDVGKKGNAVELVARISGIDLQDDSLRAGRGRTYTVGANYYFNRNVRFMVNYAHSKASDIGLLASDRKTDLVAGRLQLAF
jgi:phosphate-selective porin OprO/OprP